jgi:hypothetical protein
VTLGVRFTRKPPKPASDIPRVEQAIRINPRVVQFAVIGSFVIAAGLLLLTPNGRSPETIPITGVVAAAAQLNIAGGRRLLGLAPEEQRRALRQVARTPKVTK